MSHPGRRRSTSASSAGHPRRRRSTSARPAGHAGALALGAWLLRHAPPPPSATHDDAGGPITVVIPARDEAARLPRLLESLAAQTRPADEVVVVDDHSSDGTAQLARRAGATVVTAPDVPPGWLGKPWACHAGATTTAPHAGGRFRANLGRFPSAQDAKRPDFARAPAPAGAGNDAADLLLFLDADVVLAPDALARLAAAHAHHGGLLSVQPRHDTERPYEQLSAVGNVVTLMGTGAFSGAPRSLAVAFGPCLLVGRADYERIGGHAHPDVRGQVCEDAAIARRARSAGLPVHAYAGGSVVQFRMYPGGVRQLVEGWSKMLAGGARAAPVVPAALTAAWVTGALLGSASGARALAAATRRRQRATRPAPAGATQPRRRSAALDAAVYLAWVAEMRWLFGRVGRWHPATAWVFPLPLGAFVAFCARSAYLAATGRPARWRGRPVPAR